MQFYEFANAVINVAARHVKIKEISIARDFRVRLIGETDTTHAYLVRCAVKIAESVELDYGVEYAINSIIIQFKT
jgi:hypothetical protein